MCPKMRPKTIEEIIQILRELLLASFGGRKGGRFQISRERFKMLLGRQLLRDELIHEIAEECLNHDIVLLNMDHFFGVIEKKHILSFRNLPESKIKDKESPVSRTTSDDEPFWKGEKKVGSIRIS